MTELLMPAGNLKKLKMAFHFGADAVYLGGKDFSLRAFADNFTNDEIVEGINFAHNLGKKVYVTANIFAKNRDLKSAEEYFKFLESVDADAVLITDTGLISLCQKVAPNLNIHLSTQANTTNKYAVEFWEKQNVKRIVLARELSLEEIKEIHQYAPNIELEAFVHGAMCICYSGRCLLSSYFSNRSANSGECVQPCRWNFQITETKNHGGNPLEIEEDARGTYFMNSRDLCLIGRLKEIVDAGVCSLKVEGRMKSEFYLATVAKAYRNALDELQASGKISDIEKYKRELETVSHRIYTEAFFDGDNLDTFSYDKCLIAEEYSFVGVVEGFENGVAVIEMRNRFLSGDTLYAQSLREDKPFVVSHMWQENGTPTTDAKLVQHRYKVEIPFAVEVGDILKKKI
ncbi:MAG: U32 family peptidase [Clostridia bacterium]